MIDYKKIQQELQEEIMNLYKSRNTVDMEKQMEMLSEKMELMEEFCSLQEEYQKRQDFNELVSAGTVTEKTDEEIEALKGQWETAFVGNLSKEEKDAIHLNKFLWHVCSHKKIELLEKEEARAAFNALVKGHVIGFYQNENDVLDYRDGSMLKDLDFDLEDDIYVMDSDFNWTYIVTHAKEQWGPYFIQKNTRHEEKR